MKNYLSIAEIVVSAALIALVLFQQRGTALGSSLGGGEGFYANRRGMEKKIFWATVVFGSAFIILAVLNLAY